MPTQAANKILVEWLSQALETKGWTQSDLARAVEMTSQKINRILKDDREISAVELLKMAAVLDAELPDLPGYERTAPAAPVEEDPETGKPVQKTAEQKAFDRAYERAVLLTLDIEKMEYGGNMPADRFAHYVRKLVRTQLSKG